MECPLKQNSAFKQCPIANSVIVFIKAVALDNFQVKILTTSTGRP